MRNHRTHCSAFIALLVLTFFFQAAAQDSATERTPVPSGKPPIIIIPGLTGSNLVNSKTGEEVWFKPSRSKDDDIRLPISANLAKNRDNLIAKDVLREIKIIKLLPEIEIYERLINALETRGGYKEGKWDAPPAGGDSDTFYVFPYDWRRDNVETARKLVRDVVELKKKLGKPDLEFNVIAHSMGGLVSRYAAMYGDRDIPNAKPRPNWDGAKHFDKVFLIGTPNEGSISSLETMLSGFSYLGGGLNLPFFRDINRFDVFTIPSIFQLLPHEGSLLAYDEDLQPMNIDIYNPQEWEKYNWAIWQDSSFDKRFSEAEKRNAEPYFRAALLRAKNFQNALNANTSQNVPVKFYLIGADCKDTRSGMVLIRDEKKGQWETRFKPSEFTRSNGEKVTSDQLKSLLVAVGDSVVTQRSLANASTARTGNPNVLPIVSEIYQCEGHSKLVTNPSIQDKLFTLLNSDTVPAETTVTAEKQ